MSIPTHGETYSKLMEHLRLAQEDAAMLAHLHQMQDNVKDAVLGKGWLVISEALRGMQARVTMLAQGRLQ